MTGLYWSTLLNCRAHANIHIFVTRCIKKICKLLLSHYCQFLLCLFRYWEESAQYIFTYSSKHRSAASGSFRWVWSAVLSSVELYSGGLNYSLALQRHTGQSAVLQAPTLGHMRWMNEWCIYIALYCVLLYTQSALQSCGWGSFLNHHQCAASIWMMRRLPQDNGTSALTTHQLQVERRER